MRTVPTVGGGKGIFELFVPGAFLLLNLGGAALFLDPGAKAINDPRVEVFLSPIVAAIVIISFGYLLGIVLRIVRVGYADRASTRVIGFSRWIRGVKPVDPVYLRESFPFIESMGIRCHRDYPTQVAEYYDEVWAIYLPEESPLIKRFRIPYNTDPDDEFYDKAWGIQKRKSQGRAFFNFCKAILASEDEAAYREASAAESLSRYIASICYALGISASILLGVAVYRQWWTSASPMAPIALLLVYMVGLLLILRNYRFVRMKEAETVFALIFRHRLFFAKAEPDEAEGE